MKNSKKILGLIPARGGSKGVSGKNIKILDGKPLIFYTIEAGLKSRYLDKVVVSTDDEKIARTALRAGAEVLMRPAELAEDKTPMLPVIQHAILQQKDRPDLVVLLQPTSPLRTNVHIDKALDCFFEGGYDSLLSVCPSHAFIWKNGPESAFAVNYDFKKRINRQDKEQEYRENGAIYISKASIISDNNCILDKKVGLYAMPEEFSLEIDTEFDFKLMEKIKKIQKS